MEHLDHLKEKLKGPVFSIITPFNDDESVDYECLASYVKFLYHGGAKLFYVMGYNGRFSLLCDEEIMKVNEVVAATVNSFEDEECVTIVADPLHCSTETSIRFTQHAHEIGADLISLIFREKMYFEEQVYEHYRRISENSLVGILIHQMPLNNGIPGKPPLVTWPMALTDKVADLPNVIAIKEDTKNDAYTQEIVDVLRGRLAIIMSGRGLAQWLPFGGKVDGFLSGIGCFCPQAELQFFEAFKAGNLKKCHKIIDDIEAPFLRSITCQFGWHLGIKSALEIMGIMSRFERMPLLQLPTAQHEVIIKLMGAIIEKASAYSGDNNDD